MTFTEIIVKYLPGVMSFITIYMTLLAGNKNPKAWALALFGQCLWLVWIFTAKQWWFMPMNIALWIVYIRNHFKWNAKPDITRIPLVWPDDPVPDYFRVTVGSQFQKERLLEASEHIHYADINTDIVTVNTIAHLYLAPHLIEVRLPQEENPCK